MWIDPDPWKVGDVGFLIREIRGLRETYVLGHAPGFTSGPWLVSRRPRLVGWLGERDGVATAACGVAAVVGVAGGGRLRLRRLSRKEEIRDALRALGWPRLGR